jgi:hypothetical protein
VETFSSFYSDVRPGSKRLLAVLCDPVSGDHAAVSHARFLCVRERRLLQRSREADAETVGGDPVSLSITGARHVIFIMHLPPGISTRMRDFALDFHAPWDCAFVDDLRSARSIGGPPLVELMRQPLYNLCNEGLIDYGAIIRSSFQSALAQVLIPSLLSCCAACFAVCAHPVSALMLRCLLCCVCPSRLCSHAALLALLCVSIPGPSTRNSSHSS